MSEANKTVALQFMEAMSSIDVALAGSVVGADAVTVTKGTGRFTGTRGRDQMVGTIAAFEHMIPTGLRFTIGNVTAEGERVVVEARGDALTVDGAPYCNDYCFVFTIRDGKIRRVDEYFCTKLADEVLWPLAEKLGWGPQG